MNKHFLFVFILIFLFTDAYSGKRETVSVVNNICAQNGCIVFDFYSDDIVTKSVLEGLKKGLTAEIEYRVQLWKYNRYLPDTMEKEKIRKIKIGYDRWQKSYIIKESADKIVHCSSDEIVIRCSSLKKVKLKDIASLSGGKRYRIIVKVIVKKMSLENYEEIKRLLSGKAEDLDINSLKKEKQKSKKAKNLFFNLLLNISGFGDKIITAKSEWFTLNVIKPE